MILFEEDWNLYPSAIVDTRTKNTSFLRLSALYREMGVKNHTFLLALINPSLQGIDPFNPDLTVEEMAMIAVECKLNFWYFIREVARVPAPTGRDSGPFKANRGNIALYWLFFNHITVILIQIRQTGKSVSCDMLNRYLLNIRCVNTDITLLTKDDDLRMKNLTRLKDIEDELPFYLRLRTKNDLANTEELTIKALGNTYKGFLPQKSPKAALNVGRGLTTPIVQFDEAAFLFNIAISLPAALAAGTAARDVARANDEPYGTLITTTAGKKDDRDGRFVFNIVEGSAIWSEAFLDAKNSEQLELIIRKSSPEGKLRVNCTFNHRQLGYSDEWLKRTIEETEVSGDDANRDFFNQWTSGTQLAPLPIELLERIKKSKKDDFFMEISGSYGYATRWMIPEHQIEQVMASNFFAMAIDSSDAVGGDDIGLVLREIKSGAIAAAGNYNETNLITFCEWLVEWFVRFENFVLIIERRSTGAMIVDYLILMLVAKGIDPFRRIYNKVVQEHEEFPDRFREINKPMNNRNRDVYVQYKKTFGFATSATGATSRTELYSKTLLNAAKNTADVVYDPKVVSQILGLEIRNGRVDHREGEHDDLAIGWCLSYWLLTNGKRLDFYGINSRDILSHSVAKQKATVDPIETYDRYEQQKLRKEIEELVEEMKKERDEFISRKLENRLIYLSDQLKLEENEKFSVDELIRDLRERRSIQHINSPNRFANQQGVLYNQGISPGYPRYR